MSAPLGPTHPTIHIPLVLSSDLYVYICSRHFLKKLSCLPLPSTSRIESKTVLAGITGPPTSQDYVADYHSLEALDLPQDLFIFPDRDCRTCHVASPLTIGSLNSRAFLTLGSQRFLCMAVRLVAATCSRMGPSFATSFSATVRDISDHGTAEGKGNRMPSAIITGTQPIATDSTRRGLHGAQPSGHRQKVARTISEWNPANLCLFR